MSWVSPHIWLLPTTADFFRQRPTSSSVFRLLPTVSCLLRLRPNFPEFSDIVRIISIVSGNYRLFLTKLEFFRPLPTSADNALLITNASANVRLIPTKSNFYLLLNACYNFRILRPYWSWFLQSLQKEPARILNWTPAVTVYILLLLLLLRLLVRYRFFDINVSIVWYNYVDKSISIVYFWAGLERIRRQVRISWDGLWQVRTR
jgi:hypothetical protein